MHDLRGYVALAQSVIRLAWSDAKRGDLEARTFLEGGAMLPLWCGLAGVEITDVQRIASERWSGVARFRRRAAD